MKIPYKPIYLPKGPRKYKYIIIHDTNCMFNSFNEFKIDNPKAQVSKMRERYYQRKKIEELPFHYVCEKVNDDYESFAARPLQYSCDFSDIDYAHSHYAIHVCILGNFNTMSASGRCYQQIAYRVLSPMMRFFRIPMSNIFLHSDLSVKQLDCPGFNFNKSTLLSFAAPMHLVRG